MRRVVRAEILPEYRVALTFDDGVTGTADLTDLVGHGVFARWRDDPLAFGQLRVGPSGDLVWGDDIDLCPDALYLRVTGLTPADLFPALRREVVSA